MDDKQQLKEIATLVALHGICTGAIPDNVVDLAVGIGEAVAERLEPTGQHSDERIRRFKEAFFAMVNDPTPQPGHDPGISSDEILQWWRAAWEQSA